MAVYISGHKEITKALADAGAEVEDLKDVMAAVSREAADTMRPLVPTRSGKLRDTVRGNRAKGSAIVTVGTARVVYARVIDAGWPARNIRPARFVERTDAVMDDRVAALLEEGWDRIATKNGLT